MKKTLLLSHLTSIQNLTIFLKLVAQNKMPKNSVSQVKIVEEKLEKQNRQKNRKSKYLTLILKITSFWQLRAPH
jgi:Trp operon repressor